MKLSIVYNNDKAIITFPAESANKEMINFLLKNCDEIKVAMPWDKIVELNLNRFKFSKMNYIPIGFKSNGASSRADFIKKLAKGELKSEQIVVPGKIFIEEAKSGGVLEKPGFAEASIDLARLNGFNPIAVYAFILNQDGELADKNYAIEIAKKYGIKIFSIKDLISRRLKEGKLVERVVTATLPTKFYGTFKAMGYKTPIGEIIVLVKGEELEEVPVRIHSECLTGDVFHSLRCDCGDQLEKALKKIDKEGKGILIYMRGHEGRGIGLINKLISYKLQEEGKDTVEANIELGFPADMRSYGISAQILMDLGVKKVKLMTNNPEKIEELKVYGFEVVREPIEVEPSDENLNYLKAKKEKLGHLICVND